MSENSPLISVNTPRYKNNISVGLPVLYTDVKIIDKNEEGIGEIVIKSPSLMLGYYENPEATREAFTEDGYLKTGDLGYMDTERYLHLTGRLKNMIVTEGGKNVYPEEIENEFQLFEEIEQILVRGFVQDEKLKSEGIEALVYPSPDFRDETGTVPSKEAMKARIEKIVSEVNLRFLPYQKIIRTEILSEALEMTTTKKIKRGDN
jgi:long-chain acyl-CoA synthetase